MCFGTEKQVDRREGKYRSSGKGGLHLNNSGIVGMFQ